MIYEGGAHYTLDASATLHETFFGVDIIVCVSHM
jgi:hypothetical protein